MARGPSRRPSNDRVRIAGNLDDLVWVECRQCLGDGWHYPMRGVADRQPNTQKFECTGCRGKGARQQLAIHCGPDSRIVPGPRF